MEAGVGAHEKHGAPPRAGGARSRRGRGGHDPGAGAAGAIPPLVGWAATTGGLDWTALYLFAIVFYWTPPHFWALSLLMKDEYARVGVPMMPVVHGEGETRRQILLYTVLLTILGGTLVIVLVVVWIRQTRRDVGELPLEH